MFKNKEKIPENNSKTVFSWETPEYFRYQRGSTWYIVATILTAAAILWGIFSNNLTMALAVVVLVSVYEYTHRKHPPKIIKIEITEMGIRVGHMVFPYSHIQAFWIIQSNGLRTLNLRATNHFFSDVVIQLGDQDAAPVRQYLAGQAPEWEGKNERLSDLILRLLKL